MMQSLRLSALVRIGDIPRIQRPGGRRLTRTPAPSGCAAKKLKLSSVVVTPGSGGVNGRQLDSPSSPPIGLLGEKGFYLSWILRGLIRSAFGSVSVRTPS